MNVRGWLFTVLMLSLGASASGAESASSAIALSAGNGPLGSSVDTAEQAAQLTASSANSNATVSIARNWVPGGAAPEGMTISSPFYSFSAMASTPIGAGSSSSTTELATLDGLANSTTLTLKVIRFNARIRTPRATESEDFCNRIRKAADSVPSGGLTTGAACAQGKLDKSCGADGKSLCCSESNSRQLECANLLPRGFAEEFEKAHFDGFGGPAFGASATVGTKQFKYYPSETLQQQTKSLTPWSTQAFLGQEFSQSLVTLGYRYAVSYKDAATASICPQSASYPVDCKTGPVGIPVKTEQSIPYIEYRERFGSRVAIAPILSYDMHTSTTGLSLPIYLVPDGQGRLTGGVTVGWVSSQGGAQFGIFVGTAFSLSPRFTAVSSL